MRLDPSDPLDVYFALRLAFVDRPEVRIRTQERAEPGGSRFAPDPALWCVDAFVYDEARGEGLPQGLSERRLTQPGSLDRRVQELGVGVQAVAARELWERGEATMSRRDACGFITASPPPDRELLVDRRTGRRSFAAEVLAPSRMDGPPTGG